MRTDQIHTWQGEFGRDYTDRNPKSVKEMDALYEQSFGLTRTSLNEEFVGDLNRRHAVLEVGVNSGVQLMALRDMGFESLYGLEILAYAIRQARANLPAAGLVQASALALPFHDGAFDLVYTSGVLIHISPDHIGAALDEIYRCSKRFIWGWEYCAESYVEVSYHGRDGMLWKTNFSQLFLDHFPTLELVKERRVKYLDSDNQDSMFLLEKKW